MYKKTSKWEFRTEHPYICRVNMLLKSREVSGKAKASVYKIVTYPILAYNIAVWMLNKAEEQIIAVRERKMLLRVYGGQNGE